MADIEVERSESEDKENGILLPETEAEKVDVLDKIRAEIIDTLYVDSLIFGELIDFRNGKISADDVIEEFNQVTKIEVLQIIDKYKVLSNKESE